MTDNQDMIEKSLWDIVITIPNCTYDVLLNMPVTARDVLINTWNRKIQREKQK